MRPTSAGFRHFDTAPLYASGLSASTGSAPRCASIRAKNSRSPPRSADAFDRTARRRRPTDRLSFDIEYDYTYRRRVAFARRQPAAAGTLPRGPRADPRRESPLAWRELRTAFRRSDEGSVPRFGAPAQRRRRARDRRGRERRGRVPALRSRGQLRFLHAGRRLHVARARRARTNSSPTAWRTASA